MERSRFVACTLGAFVLITAAACADGTGKALTPTLPTEGGTATNPDGTLLKATPPQPMSPTSAATVSSLTPALTVANGAGTYEPGAPLTYRFEVLDGATVLAQSDAVAAGPGQTVWTVPANVLTNGKTYGWRARSNLGTVDGSYSNLATFKTAALSSGGGGGVAVACAGDSGEEIIACVAAAYPEKLVSTSSGDFSDERRKENMAFMRDRIIEAGRCKGMELGRNYKRGTPVISYDFIVLRRPGRRTTGVDIARGYDDTKTRLRLGWMEWEGPSYGHPYWAGYDVPFTCP